MQNAPERFTPARGTAVFAGILWVIVAAACVSMALGNETAVNAVIGASIPATFLSFGAWSLHRQDRRFAERERARRAQRDGQQTS